LGGEALACRSREKRKGCEAYEAERLGGDDLNSRGEKKIRGVLTSFKEKKKSKKVAIK